MDIFDLHAKIAAVAPIDGVSVGDPDIKSTWRIAFKVAATPTQRTNAQTVIDNYDYVTFDAAEVQRDVDFDAAPEVVDLITRAKNATNAQIDTWLTNNVTNLAQARTVLGALIKLLIAKGII
jgi:hypothetical protein